MHETYKVQLVSFYKTIKLIISLLSKKVPLFPLVDKQLFSCRIQTDIHRCLAPSSSFNIHFIPI